MSFIAGSYIEFLVVKVYIKQFKKT